MKRLSLLFVLLASVLVANAWHKRCDEAIVIVATKHLTPDAKKMVKKYLGKSYADDVHYLYISQRELTKQKKLPKGARNIHDLHLDKSFKPRAVKYDSYKAIVEALEVIRNRKSYPAKEVTTALRVVINLMCDMHNISKVRLAGYPHSYKNFTYTMPMREWGPKAVLTKTFKWRDSWRGWDGGYNFFSANYWAEDMDIFIGERYEEYAKGSLLDWAEESGRKAAYYLEFCKPDARIPYMEQKSMGVVNYEMMAKTSCRLAALLNEVTKK